MAAHSLPGLVALLTYFLLGLFTSLALMHVLQSALARKLSVALLLVASVVTGVLWLSGNRSEFLTALKDLLPHRLAATRRGFADTRVPHWLCTKTQNR